MHVHNTKTDHKHRRWTRKRKLIQSHTHNTTACVCDCGRMMTGRSGDIHTKKIHTYSFFWVFSKKKRKKMKTEEARRKDRDKEKKHRCANTHTFWGVCVSRKWDAEGATLKT